MADNGRSTKHRLPLVDAPEAVDGDPPTDRTLTPLQAELLEAGVVPEPDMLGRDVQRADVARDAGYGKDGPEPLPAPDGPAQDGETYEGRIPVFQWEIDPTHPELESHETHFDAGAWEFDVWWQRHPQGLLYVSIQALYDDPASGPERAHPMGRNVAVNLVYDERRAGVVAIYGTARDFRPFVEAFRKACGIEPQSNDEEQAP